ncbi:uncharacterized protein LOC110446080 [Mizuhopecten yessoensis]|uniref:uncharacterized protein LOC110446080 n=1 Tax=Mizuhopecten yessoensis TaxID=6573 RepID=UPI000B458663|nr:uncharacterized protein LOC110446080 [Mizuhopecten yessoensis]
MNRLILISFLASILPAALGQFECTSDSDCLLAGYHCCKGTIYCCENGYICSGEGSCISYGVIIGPVVGFVVLAIGIGFFIWRRKCRNRNV